LNNSKRVYRVLGHAEPVAANVANADAAAGPLAGSSEKCEPTRATTVRDHPL